MNRIKKVLKQQGRSQTWLAANLPKSFNIVNAWCCNRRQPTIDYLFKIAKLLDVKPSELIDDEAANRN